MQGASSPAASLQDPLALDRRTSTLGVAANAGDMAVAAELFELFKTPWQPVDAGHRYRVALDATGRDDVDADVRLVFGSGEQAVDRRLGVGVDGRPGPVVAEWASERIPIFGNVAAFDVPEALLTSAGAAIGYARRDRGSLVLRFGYDLFDEVRRLLSDGQPAAHALTPTLELHIALLRQSMLNAGVPVLEVPPRPYGYDFICCLTHDIDFFGIRRHRFDLTLAGFAARASLGSLLDLMRGRRTMSEALRNWGALATLPLVFLDVAPDFWQPFRDYAAAEQNAADSTFFLVPFKGRPGLAPEGGVNARRAVPYDARDVGDEVRQASARGSEIAVHGIDAWRDAEAGRLEMAQVTSLADGGATGVRMHWLYFDRESPKRLEDAGFTYDSTWGYNDAVGYRAGTSQVFRLLASERLMELPLSIMDSALFYRHQMNLAPAAAQRLWRVILGHASRFGGTVVVNWHDRSLAPERLWGRRYEALLEDVRGHRAWSSTAGRTVNWFRWRRSIRFVEEAGTGRIMLVATGPHVPGAVVRLHRPAGGATPGVEERPFDGHAPLSVRL